MKAKKIIMRVLACALAVFAAAFVGVAIDNQATSTTIAAIVFALICGVISLKLFMSASKAAKKSKTTVNNVAETLAQAPTKSQPQAKNPAVPREPNKPTTNNANKSYDVIIPERIDDCIRVYYYQKLSIEPVENAQEIAESMSESGDYKLEASKSEDGIVLTYQGQKFALLTSKTDMVSDWLSRGDPMLIYLGNFGPSGNHVAIAFYRNEQKRLAYREQQVVKLTAYASEDAQDEIGTLEPGDQLDIEGDDPDDGIEIWHNSRIGKLPKSVAKKYAEEGCAGVFFEKSDYDIEKGKEIPYVRIYW